MFYSRYFIHIAYDDPEEYLRIYGSCRGKQLVYEPQGGKKHHLSFGQYNSYWLSIYIKINT